MGHRTTIVRQVSGIVGPPQTRTCIQWYQTANLDCVTAVLAEYIRCLRLRTYNKKKLYWKYIEYYRVITDQWQLDWNHAVGAQWLLECALVAGSARSANQHQYAFNLFDFRSPTVSTKVSQRPQTFFDIIWFQDALFVFLLRLLFLFLQAWKPPFHARQQRFIPSWRPKAMTCLMKKQKLSISDHHVAIFFCCVWKHSVGTFFSYSILLPK